MARPSIRRFAIILAVTLLLLLCILLANAKSLKILSLYCHEVDSNFLSVELCRVKSISRDVSEVSFRLKLLQTPVDNCKVHLDMSRRGYSHLSLMKVDVDACHFLNTTRRNFFVSLVHRIIGLQKYSNMNHTCPYDHDLIIDKARIDSELISLVPAPVGVYEMRTTWFVSDVLRFNSTWNFKLY